MSQEPLEANLLRMFEPSQLIWPISIRWRTTWIGGRTWQEFAVNAPALYLNLAASLTYARILWRNTVATATSATAVMDKLEVVVWGANTGVLEIEGIPETGQRLAIPAGRESSAAIIMHSSDSDSYATRRLCIPAIPRSWEEGGLLTEIARGQLESLCHKMFMGMWAGYLDVPAGWLIPYPQTAKKTASNPQGMGFRVVNYLRVCHHTMRAPNESEQPWFKFTLPQLPDVPGA